MKTSLTLLLPLGLILIFWANGLSYLDTWPLVHEDEPWIISPGYTFWSEGRFASDLFAGFYRMERHYFGFGPIFPLWNGGLARLIGLGLFQTRLGVLILMLLALATTYRLGRQLFSAPVGLVALIFLTFFKIAAPFFHLKTGIPFVDAARIARYDMAVPVFGLLALLSLVRGLNLKAQAGDPLRLPLFFLAGLLAGLASLSHAYGLFWLPALGLLTLWVGGRKSLKPLGLLGGGFALLWLPYLIYIASGWPDFIGQHLINRSRASLAEPTFYLQNLGHEPGRYQALYQGSLWRLGSWLFLPGWPLATLFLLYRAVWAGDNGARVILLPTLGFIAGFALLISSKTYTYLATLWPLIALALAVGAVSLWRWKPAWRGWQPLLLGLLLAASLEGGWGLLQFQRTAARVTPYTHFTAEIRGFIPPESRILAFQHYWLGLSSFSYRSMLLPLFLASDQHVQEPVPFYQALARTGADVILVDEVMQRYLEAAAAEGHSFHQNWLDFNRYLADHGATVLARFRDPSYGRVTIYLLDQADLSGSQSPDWEPERLPQQARP